MLREVIRSRAMSRVLRRMSRLGLLRARNTSSSCSCGAQKKQTRTTVVELTVSVAVLCDVQAVNTIQPPLRKKCAAPANVTTNLHDVLVFVLELVQPAWLPCHNCSSPTPYQTPPLPKPQTDASNYLHNVLVFVLQLLQPVQHNQLHVVVTAAHKKLHQAKTTSSSSSRQVNIHISGVSAQQPSQRWR